MRYAGSRLVQLVVSLWVALTLLFVAVTQLPGDPVRALFGFTPPPPELYESIRRRYGLDEPLWEQYLTYLRNVVTGNLGYSYPLDPWGEPSLGPAVNDTLAAAAPVSAVLLLGAVVLQVVVGITAGAISGFQGVRLSGGIYGLAVLLVSTPVLVAAYVLRAVFGVELGWLPREGLHQGPLSYLLPVVALSALSIGYVILLTRSEVRETLAAPYLRAARSRGYRTSRLLAVHALRPSLIPVVAFLAANVGQLFVGLIIVEGVFDLPGVGGAVFQSIRERDRSLLVGLVTVFLVVVLVANAVADLLLAVIDPRVRLDTPSR